MPQSGTHTVTWQTPLPTIQETAGCGERRPYAAISRRGSTMVDFAVNSDEETLGCCQEKDDVSKKGRRHQHRRYFNISSFRLVNAMIWITMLVLFSQTRSLRSSNVHFESSERDFEGANASMDVPRQASLLQSSGELTKQTEIVHIIHTRFMQDQPNLVDLGRARLELLKAFPQTSLEKQSSQNFVWIIRTDPNLNKMLKENLIDALKSQGRHLLLASNDNPNVQIDELLSIDANSIWSGDYKEVKDYLSAAKSLGSLVLESRLDADDALHKDFVSTVQGTTESHFAAPHNSMWKIWCASHHMEWQYNSMWETDSPETGALLSIRDSECISTGLTISYRGGNVKAKGVPPMKHNQLAKAVPSCQKQNHECLDFVNLQPTALRARTPTSAGMMNVLLNNKTAKDATSHKYKKAGAGKQGALQYRLWRLVESVFGFSTDSAIDVHSHLERNMRAIAKDNLKGQCTAGHSCKESSRSILQTIIDHPEKI